MISKLYAKVYNFFNAKEEGATMVEYGLMVALIACACIAAVTLLGTGIAALFTQVDTNIDAATTAAS